MIEWVISFGAVILVILGVIALLSIISAIAEKITIKKEKLAKTFITFEILLVFCIFVSSAHLLIYGT